jgi:hypothetical protein
MIVNRAVEDEVDVTALVCHRIGNLGGQLDHPTASVSTRGDRPLAADELASGPRHEKRGAGSPTFPARRERRSPCRDDVVGADRRVENGVNLRPIAE